MIFLPDYHVHTSFSPDGESEIDQCIRYAKSNCITDLIITDHFECNAGAVPPQYEQWPLKNPSEYFNYLYPFYYQSDLRFGIGIELGQPLQNLDNALYFLNSFNWDYVLGSLHNIKNEYDFYYLDYSVADFDKLFQNYFLELFEMVKWGQFDVLSHLFYFIKYMPLEKALSFIQKYNYIIFDILKECIYKGIGIEVNTSGLRSGLGITIPNFEYLKTYRKLGGELITIGSDAHKAQDIGSGCLEAISMIKDAGFKYISQYVNRNPIQIKVL